MQKELNISLITQRTSELGLNQTKLSQEIGVSREAVSQWLSNENFPRADKLLQLGQLLKLKYSELVNIKDLNEPIIAFRKVGNAKTTEQHIKNAKLMGFELEKLVKYLPFETITKPQALNKPQNDYNYLQSAVLAIRESLGIKKIRIETSEIINFYKKSKTILIPVLLGDKKKHENALHIHLPESATNWVYINLDTSELDFKFWLVHEIGHIITPDLRNDEAEEFADNFAGAFLFPKEIAQKAYMEIMQISNNNSKIRFILNYASRYFISAYTVYYEINKYAENEGKKKINLGNDFHPQNKNFGKTFKLVSENLFGKNKPKAEEFINVCEREFQTLFFEMLRKYMSSENYPSSYIRSILNISVIDALEIYRYLLNGVQKNTP